MDGVAGAFVAGLGVDDGGFVFTVGDDVGLARQSCRPAAEFKPVLSLDVDVVGADFPVTDPLIDERGVVEQPLGPVEVRGLPGPVLVMGFVPDGPLAGVFARQEARQPGGPDVGVFAGDGPRSGRRNGTGAFGTSPIPATLGPTRAGASSNVGSGSTSVQKAEIWLSHRDASKCGAWLYCVPPCCWSWLNSDGAHPASRGLARCLAGKVLARGG